MSWADGTIAVLKRGKEAWCTPHGNSMLPRIKSGQKVLIQPVDVRTLKAGDVVLVKVKGVVYLHLLRAVGGSPDAKFQISNNKGRVNGWVTGDHIYGKADI